MFRGINKQNIFEDEEDKQKIIETLGYNKNGHLFQERFKTDAYFLMGLRYIHQNPLKAGIARDISKYLWSSYQDYVWIPVFSGKLYEALDMSGGFIVYDKTFPAEGRYYNFMWRIGPRFIYKISENSSVNIGYMLMHVSNGFKTQILDIAPKEFQWVLWQILNRQKF
jgi:hypothetical protein